MNKKYLIVEGYYDFLFYTSLFNKLKIKDIKIIPPQSLGFRYNGKGNTITLLKDLIKQFYDGSVEKIGIIVDADFKDISKQGFHNTLHDIKGKVEKYGYEPFTKPNDYHNGIILKSSKGLPDIAVWIMPDDKNEGYLEYLLLDVIDSSNKRSTEEAGKICNDLKNYSFPEHHRQKSFLAIFMAMQENPGRNITHLIEKDYIDFQNGKMEKLINFIIDYYK
ncbi:hypothetical protein QUF80_10100 [Desulfococcaceae bacterium HSG8]|nr:hypothetical protein [Desulfococcaceae bacterium HSG8]